MSDTKMMPQEISGFLFIGDPHVSSRRIGRRKDNYLESVLEKLATCAEIANAGDLQAVITGDLFHRSDDSNLRMLNLLIRVLKKFSRTPVSLDGNHDRQCKELDDSDAFSLLVNCGAIRQLDGHSLSASHQFDINGVPVVLYGCSHGVELPDALPELPGGVNILVTHHDLALGGSYPNAIPLKEIKNCPLVVNGHMHDTKKPEVVGETCFENPGNIEPLSVDLMHHIPRAWLWVPEQGASLEGIELPHGTDLFDLTGIQVDACDATSAVRDVTGVAEPRNSEFAMLLSEESDSDAQRTSDASIFMEDLDAVLGNTGISDATRELLKHLSAGLSSST